MLSIIRFSFVSFTALSFSTSFSNVTDKVTGPYNQTSLKRYFDDSDKLDNSDMMSEIDADKTENDDGNTEID
jgi:hypothetical protein